MRIPGLFFGFLICAVIAVPGCNQKSTEKQDDIDAINELYNRYIQSAKARDLDGFMTCWAEDGIRAEPGLPAIIGKENIRTRFDELLSAPVDFEFTQLGEPLIDVVDDMAYSFRTLTLASTFRDGSPALIQDMKVLTIYKRQEDGSWLAYIDCINYHPTWSMDTIPDEMIQDNPYY